MKNVKSKEAIAVLTTEYGTVSFHDTVFESIVKQAIVETPGVTEITLRQLFKPVKGQRIEVEKGETSDRVMIHVSVWMKGPLNVIEVSTQVQKRLKYDLEQCLGVTVEEVYLTVENIVFE